MSNSLPPNQWRESSLGDLAEVAIGGTPSRDNEAFWATGSESGFPWVSIADLKGRTISETKEQITNAGVLGSNVKLVSAGTVLMSFKLTLGRVAFAGTDLYTNEAIAAFRTNDAIDDTYLYYVLPDAVRCAATDTAIKGATLNKDSLRSLRLRYPEKSNQKKIAIILTSVDTAIEKTEALIEKYQQIKAGLMHDLFTRGVLPNGQLRPPREQAPELYQETAIGWIPLDWRIDRIEAALSRIIDYRGKTPEKTVSGVPLITARNVRMGYIESEPREFIAETDYGTWMTRGIPNTGDILFTTEAPLGNVAQVSADDRTAFAQRVIILQPSDQIRATFLAYRLMTETIQRAINRLASGSTALGIKQSEFRKILIGFPADPEEQGRIELKLEAMDGWLFRQLESKKKLKQQKLGLMQDLLTGKVPVKVGAGETAND